MTHKARPPAQDYVRFAEAVVALALAKLAISLLPFRLVANSTHWRRGTVMRTECIGSGDKVKIAIRRAAQRLPWRSVCFDQGLAAHWMLRRRRLPSLLHYGIGSNEDRLTAHVWVSLYGSIVIGESEAGRHAQVATFPDELS